MADPVTSWVDARIKVAVEAAVAAALTHEDEAVARFAQELEALPQQLAAQVATLAATLPSVISQAISNLFPHFLRHLADLPPTERDTLLRRYASQAVET